MHAEHVARRPRVGRIDLHRVPAQCKVVALVLFVLAVVATPRTATWAFGCFAAGLVTVAAAGGVLLRRWLARLAFELPFIGFALALPFVSPGPEVQVWGLGLSVEGLWAAWNIVAKATLGVAAATLMASTTPAAEMLAGLDRLRLPRVFTAIAGFMVRYLDLTADQVRRMAVARAARGERARWLWQARAAAASAGTLFIRSFERGERVHLAMVSRGYDGTMPDAGGSSASVAQWAGSILPAAAAAAIAALAVVGLR